MICEVWGIEDQSLKSLEVCSGMLLALDFDFDFELTRANSYDDVCDYGYHGFVYVGF